MNQIRCFLYIGFLILNSQFLNTFAQDSSAEIQNVEVENVDIESKIGYWELPDMCNRGFKKMTCLKFQGAIELINVPYTNETGRYNMSVEIPANATATGSCCAGEGLEQVLALTWTDLDQNRTIRAEFNFSTEILSIDPLTYRIGWQKALVAVGWNRITPFEEIELLNDNEPEQNVTSYIFLENLIDYSFESTSGYSYSCNSTQEIQEHIKISYLQFQLGHSMVPEFAPAIECDMDNMTTIYNPKDPNNEGAGENESYTNIIIGMGTTIGIIVLIIYLVSKYNSRSSYENL